MKTHQEKVISFSLQEKSGRNGVYFTDREEEPTARHFKMDITCKCPHVDGALGAGHRLHQVGKSEKSL